MILNVHISVLFDLHVYVIPSPFLWEWGRGRDVKLVKRNENGCYFMGVGHKKSGTPDCGRNDSITIPNCSLRHTEFGTAVRTEVIGYFLPHLCTFGGFLLCFEQVDSQDFPAKKHVVLFGPLHGSISVN